MKKQFEAELEVGESIVTPCPVHISVVRRDDPIIGYTIVVLIKEVK